MSLLKILPFIIPYLTIRELNVLNQVFKFNDDIWGLYLEKKFSSTILYKDKVKLYYNNSVEFSETKKKVFQNRYKDSFDIGLIERIFQFDYCYVIFSTFDGRYFIIDKYDRVNVETRELNYMEIEELFNVKLKKRIYSDSKFNNVFNRKEYKKLKCKFMKKHENNSIFGIISDNDISLPGSKDLIHYLTLMQFSTHDNSQVRKYLVNSCNTFDGIESEIILDSPESDRKINLERVIEFMKGCYFGRKVYQGMNNCVDCDVKNFNNIFYYKYYQSFKYKNFLYYKYIRTEKKIFWKIIVDNEHIDNIVDKLSDEEMNELLEQNCRLGND